LISQIAITNNNQSLSIMDIGAGANPVLIEQCLKELKQVDITVLDISQCALDKMRQNLADLQGRVKYIVGNVCDTELFSELEESMDIIHDRAVFHFLTESVDRELYVQNMHRALRKGGQLIVGTFALPDGPLQCSGINIVRYDEESLKKQMENYFELVKSTHEMHKTPSNTIQHFIFCQFVKKD
jgi:ubiquinone/menaquinone biosynthesis C-methylase UbiE